MLSSDKSFFKFCFQVILYFHLHGILNIMLLMYKFHKLVLPILKILRNEFSTFLFILLVLVIYLPDLELVN